MKTFLKVMAGLGLAIALFAAFIQFAPLAKNDIPYPEVSISTDSAVLARGEYLIYGPSHCVECHCREKDDAALKRGEKVPLAGGKVTNLPFARIPIPNLTPDKETGIGNIENGAIARAIRFATNHRGNTMIPRMRHTHMSDYDVSAIISYLRAQKPVHNPVPPSEFTFEGKFRNRFMFKPLKPTKPIPAIVAPGPTATYGEYLVNEVGGCIGCHTLRTFDYWKMDVNTAVLLTGGVKIKMKKHLFTTPNLTPDVKTGHIYNWPEEAFVARFKAGRVYEDSPMPWENYQRMTENDLRAIYKYLRSIPPTENKVEPIVANL